MANSIAKAAVFQQALDKAMLQNAATGFMEANAMGVKYNGGAEIKEAADYITDDVNEDGLYNAFKHLGLI